MGVQKRRMSKAKTGSRRSAWKKMTAPNLQECPQCHELKQPHRACPSCGYYKGSQVMAAAENK